MVDFYSPSNEFVMGADSLVITQALSELSHPPSSVASVIYGMRTVIHEFCRVNISHIQR